MDFLNSIIAFFNVDNIALTILDYPMSWIELIGTICYLASVILIARRKMITWLIGIISSILYMLLFYQIRLYADTIEQIYYLIVSAYGWWFWIAKGRETNEGKPRVKVRYSSQRMLIITVIVTVVLGIAAGVFISNADTLLPEIFPEPAAFPYLDAVTTIMSFVAMWLMAQKRTESWIYWIIVDVIGIGLYYAQNVRFISLLYVILLGLAINGFINWHRDTRSVTLATSAG